MLKKPEIKPIVIRKYANRRLYDTDTSAYVTLDDLCNMVKGGKDFIVQDAKTGEDLTRSVLTQIIFEQESKGYNILPVAFLRRIISFYDDNLRTLLPHYLESSMEAFSQNQNKMRDYLSKSPVGDVFGNLSPVKQFEMMGKHNMDLFQQAVDMFSQFNPMQHYFQENPKEKVKKSS